jgi:hypothetical protein
MLAIASADNEAKLGIKVTFVLEADNPRMTS